MDGPRGGGCAALRVGGEAGRAPSGGLRSCACSPTGWGRHHHHHKKQGGVGFLIHKKPKGNIEEFHATSIRVASATIRISKRYKIRIIQVYAPTSVSSQEELEEFYDDLQTEMRHKKTHYNVIMGDFNAKVGKGD